MDFVRIWPSSNAAGPCTRYVPPMDYFERFGRLAACTARTLMLNDAFHNTVRDLYQHEVAILSEGAADVTSQPFLAEFPYAFIRYRNEEDTDGYYARTREALLTAAFSDEFSERTERAIRLFFEDHSGGSTQSYFFKAVDDFLNFAIPRCIGLPNEIEQFEKLYSRFEEDLWSDTFTLQLLSLIEGVADHGLNFRPTAGVSFSWPTASPAPATTPYLRENLVTYLELKKSGSPIGGGRSLEAKTNFFLMNFSESVQKTKGAVSIASARSDEITRKVTFLLRVLTSSPVFSDYRGYRIVGHLGSLNLTFMNWPDDYVEDCPWHDMGPYLWHLERLLPHVLATDLGSVEVIEHKLDDALRRRRTALINSTLAEKRVAVDRLLDYLQILEAILPAKGSYQIAMNAAILLGGHLGDGGAKTRKVFDEVRKMYGLRNAVMHGRIDQVIGGKKARTTAALDIRPLQRNVHDLTVLKLLNPHPSGNLNDLAERLLLRETVVVNRLNG